MADPLLELKSKCLLVAKGVSQRTILLDFLLLNLNRLISAFFCVSEGHVSGYGLIILGCVNSVSSFITNGEGFRI